MNKEATALFVKSSLRIIASKAQNSRCKLDVSNPFMLPSSEVSTQVEKHVYLKYREANVEVLAQVSSPLVRFLQDRHVDVLLIGVFQIIPMKLDSKLWISPETVWGKDRKRDYCESPTKNAHPICYPVRIDSPVH